MSNESVKLAVVGTRTFQNYALLCKTLDNYQISLIISGGAAGADKLAEIYAKEKNIPIKIYYPEWEKYGKSAGPIRNEFIVRESDCVIAFWDGISRGTLSSINICKKMNKPLTIIKYN